MEAESYVHRVGRTGRAVSLCDRDERGLPTQIERLIQCRLSEWVTT
jgi:superfamily II DNA/RNA helicase